MFLNIFEKVIQMHGLQICRFHCNLMHTLLGNNSKEEKIYKITGNVFLILLFISFRKTSQYGSVSIPPYELLKLTLSQKKRII